ncbi:unnamed protein product [Mytilus edulis]|uniref:Ig-like domain-containing protein n=1 Tax=Mytilus edulis TaxID=6550 RepID=A0A8S3QVS5_MYTED|nr:unnamed protein product [Mytilus edulis]
MSENCSHYRTSNLTFTVTAKDNNAVIRCVVKSSMAEPDMYVETEPLEVYYPVRIPTIINHPNKTEYVLGEDTSIHLACKSDGNPKPSYFWYKENPKQQVSLNENFTITNLNITDSGAYTCKFHKKTTGYEDIDLDDTDMKFKILSDEETIAKVKQHNEEYLKKLKEDEEREKDNPTQPPQAAVYACVNKPKSTVPTENKPPAGQQEEDVYEDSKEGLYDTSGDRRHKENITVENYDSTENLKNEGNDHNDLFSEKNSQINKAYDNSKNKEEKRQVAAVSPTVRLSQVDERKNTSNEIQLKTEKQTTHETSL